MSRKTRRRDKREKERRADQINRKGVRGEEGWHVCFSSCYFSLWFSSFFLSLSALESLLIMPAQRIPRYMLLLMETEERNYEDAGGDM